MSQRTPAQIRSKAEMARKVVQHHFGKSGKHVEFKPAGKTNYVFDVSVGSKNYIVRISDQRTKLNDFIKEQWVAQKVSEKGVPVPEILEVGNEIIPLPYMLQEKINGREATDHPSRGEILKELGRYAKLIHSVPTNGFGHSFDWSKNKLSKKRTWSEFLKKEIGVDERLAFLKAQNILSKKKIERLAALLRKICSWKIAPSLNHCDLRLKNVIVNKAGQIKAIIDWENCSSNIAPYWDFSIALHDLSIDNKQKFLEGYGLDFKEFDRMAFALTAFNLINYVPTLKQIITDKDSAQLEFYKLRINGALDLFSL